MKGQGGPKGYTLKDFKAALAAGDEEKAKRIANTMRIPEDVRVTMGMKSRCIKRYRFLDLVELEGIVAELQAEQLKKLPEPVE